MDFSGPFRLCVPSKDGDVLTVNLNGELFYDKPDKGEDDSWLLIPADADGFYLVSSNHNLVIIYNPEQGEDLTVTPFNPQGEYTIWHTTPDSEIYTIDSNGENRYLWSILNSVYVTPDEHLAEKWSAVSMEGYDVGLSSPPPSEKHHTPFVVVGSVLLLLIFFMFLKSST